MTAKLLDGNALAKTLRESFKDRVASLSARGQNPGLAVIIVGDDPASRVYVRNKVAACEAAGIYSEKIAYPADVAPGTVFDRIAALNADERIHGILVQLPLPAHLDEAAVLEAIAPEKDVDGFHAENVGALAQGNPRFIPCTPYGVMKLLEHAGVTLAGKEAVIVGRSNIVGKPMAQLLLAQHATVTVCHSRTRDLASHTRRADIVVAAVGKARMITGDMIKPGAVVIDVGINRLQSEEGVKLCGDVDAESCKEIAWLITPVPGGIGPMTITMLLANTIEAADRKFGIRNTSRSISITTEIFESRNRTQTGLPQGSDTKGDTTRLLNALAPVGRTITFALMVALVWWFAMSVGFGGGLLHFHP